MSNGRKKGEQPAVLSTVHVACQAAETPYSLPAVAEPERIIGVLCPRMGQRGCNACATNERMRAGSAR